MNPRITPRERGLIKGALRRSFARSDLRRKVLEASVISHIDPTRPRVKTWVKCATCGKPEAKSYCVIDHVEPVIPVDSSFEEMSLDDVVDRMWCDPTNLLPICEACHIIKTKSENRQRREYKNAKSKSKSPKRAAPPNRKRSTDRRTRKSARR